MDTYMNPDGHAAVGVTISNDIIMGPDVSIGDGVKIGSAVTIGAGSRIGSGSNIYPHSSIPELSIIGALSKVRGRLISCLGDTGHGYTVCICWSNTLGLLITAGWKREDGYEL